jgi:pimeloyl-ACP methyl ester carboxylesterase
MPAFFDTPQGRRLAYLQLRPTSGIERAGLVFLHGLGSDMNGTKAEFLAAHAEATGRAFLRFDFSGHGASSGAFSEGSIGDWTADAAAIIKAKTVGKQVLIGSSMGGWVALLLARAMPGRVAGLIGIAAAPDFTEKMVAEMEESEKNRMKSEGKGFVADSSPGGTFEVWSRLIDDGRRNLVLNRPLDLPFPVRLFQGTMDSDVPVATALNLVEHARCRDLRLTLVKGADHRFSGFAELELLRAAVDELA